MISTNIKVNIIKKNDGDVTIKKKILKNLVKD